MALLLPRNVRGVKCLNSRNRYTTSSSDAFEMESRILYKPYRLFSLSSVFELIWMGSDDESVESVLRCGGVESGGGGMQRFKKSIMSRSVFWLFCVCTFCVGCVSSNALCLWSLFVLAFRIAVECATRDASKFIDSYMGEFTSINEEKKFANYILKSIGFIFVSFSLFFFFVFSKSIKTIRIPNDCDKIIYCEHFKQ